MSSYRKERLNDLLLSFLAEQMNELRDPRLQFLTITGVDISNDLKVARVYWALPPVVESEDEKASETESGPAQSELVEKHKKEAEQALKPVVKLLRRRIAEQLELRYVPELVFKYDRSSVTGPRIDYLLKKAGF